MAGPLFFLRIIETGDFSRSFVRTRGVVLLPPIHIDAQVLLDVIGIGDFIDLVDDTFVDEREVEIGADGAVGGREPPQVVDRVVALPCPGHAPEPELEIVTKLAFGEFGGQGREIICEGLAQCGRGHM